jgi:AraC-like DNA-binding protein
MSKKENIIEDDELKQAAAVLDRGYPLLRFPRELEKKYISHHAQTRLITSSPLVFIGICVFSLFCVLDYIVFPFHSAVNAWIIRAVTVASVTALIYYYRFIKKMKMGYFAVSTSILIINTAVVFIDIIGVNNAGYMLPLGALYVMIAASTLVRFPFWVSLSIILLILLTQLSGLLIFTQLGVADIAKIFLYNAFIALMLLFSNYSTDSDSRKIFLLNIIRKKYERSSLTKEEAGRDAERLHEYMITEKPYLDPDLRIEDVAKALKIKRHHLTQIISETYNKNFFTYINEFRISDALKMMSDVHNNEMTILRIAYDTGFNSKSSFNRIFKNITGKSPSEYKGTSKST